MPALEARYGYAPLDMPLDQASDFELRLACKRLAWRSAPGVPEGGGVLLRKGILLGGWFEPDQSVGFLAAAIRRFGSPIPRDFGRRGLQRPRDSKPRRSAGRHVHSRDQLPPVRGIRRAFTIRHHRVAINSMASLAVPPRPDRARLGVSGTHSWKHTKLGLGLPRLGVRLHQDDLLRRRRPIAPAGHHARFTHHLKLALRETRVCFHGTTACRLVAGRRCTIRRPAIYRPPTFTITGRFMRVRRPT